jgi:hypothetical protein
MSLNLLAVHDQITAKLNTDLPQDVYETAVPDDKKIGHGANALFKPYVVVTYGDMTEAGNQTGIISAKYNLGMSYCTIACVAPTQRAARQVADLVRNSLVGFRPTDGGELRLAGGRNYGDVDGNAVPKKYISELNFVFPVNTVW